MDFPNMTQVAWVFLKGCFFRVFWGAFFMLFGVFVCLGFCVFMHLFFHFFGCFVQVVGRERRQGFLIVFLVQTFGTWQQSYFLIFPGFRKILETSDMTLVDSESHLSMMERFLSSKKSVSYAIHYYSSTGVNIIFKSCLS